jgi:hypothetical protein
MLATFILAVSLLHVAVYAEAAIIIVLLLALGFVWFQGTQWMRDCEQAEAEHEEARKTVHTLRRMSEIHADTVTRLREHGR